MKKISAIAQTFILTSFSFSALSLFALAPVQAASFIGLGWLSTTSSSYASDVSADGSVVVGSSNTDSYITGQAFRWTKVDGMVALGPLVENVFGGIANAVSADGTVVVGDLHKESFYPISPFRWTQETGMVDLGYIFYPDDFLSNYSYTHDVSGDGSVIVGSAAAVNKAFRWSESSGVIFLEDGQANAVSADGSVVVGGTEGKSSEAFRWTQETGIVGLGYLAGGEGQESHAYGVSDDGSIVVGFSEHQAFRWTQETGMVGLGTLTNDSISFARGVSADGSVVVGYDISYDINRNQSEAFVWTHTGGIVSLKETLIGEGLDVSGWTLSSATAISADGFTIVGNGTNPSGQSEAWVANLSPEAVPEPLTILGAMTAAAFGIGFKRQLAQNKSDEKDSDA